MQDEHKTKEQLMTELAALRQRVAELEHDTADRRVVEAALKESEERFRLIFHNLRDGLLLADNETKKFLMGNPAIHRMLGYSPEELTHLGLTDIHPEQDLPWVTHQFEQLAKGDIEISRNIPVRRKDGDFFYADISPSPQISFHGKECLMGVFRDITEQRRWEEALLKSEETLQQSEKNLRSLN